MAAWPGSVVGDQTETEDGLGGREHLGFHCEAKRGNEGLYGKDTREVVIVLCGDFWNRREYKSYRPLFQT